MHFSDAFGKHRDYKKEKKDKILPTPPQPSPYPTIPSSVVVKEKKSFTAFYFARFFFLRQLSFVEETSLFLRERFPMTVKHIIFRYSDFTNSRAYLTLVR